MEIVISIHAPTRGATMISSRDIVEITISIHAPTRGATGLCRFRARIFTISIHAPTRGATSQAVGYASITLYFNPRSYKRSDGGRGSIKSNFWDFNPRSYKRSDYKGIVIDHVSVDISIHAPTRGATAKMHNYPYTYL